MASSILDSWSTEPKGAALSSGEGVDAPSSLICQEGQEDEQCTRTPTTRIARDATVFSTESIRNRGTVKCTEDEQDDRASTFGHSACMTICIRMLYYSNETLTIIDGLNIKQVGVIFGCDSFVVIRRNECHLDSYKFHS
ncbi:hypothetical protein CAPTEDRAFT_203888 [Capitella teleta]|uniref:Uncharacterized protein n=1 Tax=Capitella teleta TaxID=283909 RepID=R7UNQ4_CAPTE|nr:hypothetical protein CAPTEDRAFT_203888 [Capitella teleta]|eukprot:ELU07860.1 hypothetical protein CAPTEDRAFT_203888 [Capitella teleta]